MRLKNRVMVIISASLASLTVMGLFGLYTMRQSVMEEREAQIVQLLDFADSQLRYFHALELNGHMNREVAQARAMEAISAQRQDSNYFFIRSLTDDRSSTTPYAARMGTDRRRRHRCRTENPRRRPIATRWRAARTTRRSCGFMPPSRMYRTNNSPK
jgi:hypothetical protein